MTWFYNNLWSRTYRLSRWYNISKVTYYLNIHFLYSNLYINIFLKKWEETKDEIKDYVFPILNYHTIVMLRFIRHKTSKEWTYKIITFVWGRSGRPNNKVLRVDIKFYNKKIGHQKDFGLCWVSQVFWRVLEIHYVRVEMSEKYSKKVSGNKRFLIPKNESAREYCVKKEGTTTCHTCKYTKKGC